MQNKSVGFFTGTNAVFLIKKQKEEYSEDDKKVISFIVAIMYGEEV